MIELSRKESTPDARACPHSPVLDETVAADRPTAR